MSDVVFSIFLKIRSCIFCSLNESRLLVASSNTKSFEDESNARAIASRCFSPPEKLAPPSSTNAPYRLGSLSMNVLAPAILHADIICSQVASRFPILRLSRIVPVKSWMFCGMQATFCLSAVSFVQSYYLYSYKNPPSSSKKNDANINKIDGTSPPSPRDCFITYFIMHFYFLKPQRTLQTSIFTFSLIFLHLLKPCVTLPRRWNASSNTGDAFYYKIKLRG